MHTNKLLLLVTLLSTILLACNSADNSAENKDGVVIAKGLYSFGPEVKSFTDCEEGREFWVADSAKTLELAYNELGFEKPYTPVYVELECRMIKSDTTINGNYDSTMIVTKLLKISKQIPEGPCSQ